jgi:tRNA threonylcarbamoyladenosine biosynthesis protein TsaE
LDKSYTTISSDQTFNLGKQLAISLKSGDIVALYGGLGAGKTVFAKGIASGLGITEEVVSPTFTMLKQYSGDLLLHHFDLYRIEDEEELAHIGFYDYLGSEGVCVIEWADNADELPSCIEVRFKGSGSDERTIEIKGLQT